MTLMTDRQIRKALEDGKIILDPPPEDHDIQPTSVDVHLGDTFQQYRNFAPLYINALDKNHARHMVAHNPNTEGEVHLASRGFMLGIIKERLTLANDIACRIEGKSSIGRLGVAIHVTAGFVDPGWDGNLTIEILNHSPTTIILTSGMRISQLCFYQLGEDVERPYGHSALHSRYQGQDSPGASRGTSTE